MQDGFDIFLSYNRHDKEAVEAIGAWLEGNGLRVWLDRWKLRPGVPWQGEIEAAVEASGAVAAFVGAAGLGAWQEPEIRAFIERSRREKVAVIPVLIPGCSESPELAIFLRAFTWVDLRGGVTEGGLSQLLWGITGRKPGETDDAAGTAGTGVVAGDGESAVAGRAPAIPLADGGSSRRTRRPRAGQKTGPALRPDPTKREGRWGRWGFWVAVLGVAVAVGAWLWPQLGTGHRPEMYAVRVQVLDPEGRPVVGSTVRTSAGNEPHLLPDGWWQVEVPTAKLPSDGRISLRADHQDWEGNQVYLDLGADPNPRVEIRLRQPETSLRGRVADKADRALSRVRVTWADGAPGGNHGR